MDYSVLEKSTLFAGIPAKELRDDLETVPHHIQCYDKGETVSHLMEDANRIGIIHHYDVPQRRYPAAPAKRPGHHEKLYDRACYRNYHATAESGIALL